MTFRTISLAWIALILNQRNRRACCTSLLIAIPITCDCLTLPSGTGSLYVMEPEQGKVDHIRTNLRRLYSERQSDRANAVRRLEQLAQDSPDSRAVIVVDLMHTLDDPRTSFDTRKAAMDILGDLRATEAVGALIRHLTDLQGMTGLPEHWYPAVHALHQIGSPAIPELAKALSDHTDPRTRMYAAQALGSIGGKVAQEKLEQALPKEPIDYVRNMIKDQLWGLWRATEKSK